jgi:hypothetical protein
VRESLTALAVRASSPIEGHELKTRLFASVAIAAAIAVGATGCTFLAPQATRNSYSPSDGTDATVGDVQIRNALIITSGSNVGNLVFTAVNSSEKTVSLTAQLGSSATSTGTVEVGPSVTRVGGVDDQRVLYTKFSPEAGSLAKVYFQYGSATGTQIQVPVLTGALSEYAQYVVNSVPTTAPAMLSTETATATPTPAG